MSFVINKKLPIGESKYDWYTKMAAAIELFAPKNSRYVLIGENNIDIVRLGGHLILDETIDKTSQRYLIGKLGKLDVYVDKYMGNSIGYESRFSKEDMINGTYTSLITGRIAPGSIHQEVVNDDR